MRHGANSAQLVGVCLALGLGVVSALAQGHHLDALREWLGYTEEAAKLVDKRDYVKAEQQLNAAIREIRPYFPETKRNLREVTANWPGCSIIRNGMPRPSPWLDGPSPSAIPTKTPGPSLFFSAFTRSA